MASRGQLLIALGKLHSGYKPGCRGWTDIDQSALDEALGLSCVRDTRSWKDKYAILRQKIEEAQKAIQEYETASGGVTWVDVVPLLCELDGLLGELLK